jgi:uncharacterized damage-inducible protein DinB
MIETIRELFLHQAWADQALIGAIEAHADGRDNEEIRTLLHHMLATHRFFVLNCQGLPLSQDENVVPADLQTIGSRYRETQEMTAAWLRSLSDADLERTLELPFFAGRQIPVRAALLQVILHSQGHRSQCASRFRMLGGKAPTTDYILWAKDRPAPALTT